MARREPGRWLAAGQACSLLLGVGLATSGCATSNAGARADGRIAYCLDDAMRPALTAVANRLNIPVPGQSLDTWRGADFDRACDALMAAKAHPVPAAGPAVPTWLTDLLGIAKSLGLLLLGAALTLLTGGLRDTGTRRRLHAAQLRTATDNFVNACETFLDSRVDLVTDATAGPTLRDRRQELLAKLRELHALYRGKVDPTSSVRLLNDKLDRSIQRDWELSRTRPDRQDRATTVRASLTALVEHTEAINRKLEQSLLAWLGSAK